jgi:hypothetical protein
MHPYTLLDPTALTWKFFHWSQIVFKMGGVISVAKGCRLLKTLKLQCVGASDEALDAIGSFCLLLEILSLSNFERFTDRYLCNCILYPDVICIVAIFLAILCAEIQEGRTLISIRISQNNVEVLCNQCQ